MTKTETMRSEPQNEERSEQQQDNAASVIAFPVYARLLEEFGDDPRAMAGANALRELGRSASGKSKRRENTYVG